MLKKIVNLIFEAMHMQRVKHEGRRLASIEQPDSIAEHSLGAAQIGYILAQMEGADAHKVATILVRHDIAETRIGDMHKIGSRYIENKKEIENKVMRDQFSDMPFEEDIMDIFTQYNERSTLEGIIAKDADYLQMAFQAKDYLEKGYSSTQNWIDNVGKALKTESAQKIWKEMTESNSTDWWYQNDLKKIPTS